MDCDTVNNTFSKSIRGYTVNSEQREQFTGEIVGTKPLFYIPCTEVNNTIKIAENIKATSQIISNMEVLQDNWWNENLEQSFRSEFCTFLIDSSLPKYGLDYPFNEQLSKSKIEESNLYFDQISIWDEETWEELYDENGDLVYEIDTNTIDYRNIHKIEFIEDWYFDTLTLSIKKDVKGAIPQALINHYDHSEKKRLYLHKFKGKGFEKSISNVNIKNISVKLYKTNLQKEEKDYLIKNEKDPLNLFGQDSSTTEKIYTNYFNKCKTNLDFYGFLNYAFDELKLINDSLYNGYNSIIESIPVFDEETWEELYDENGNAIYDETITPYSSKNIIGTHFFEDWHYDYSNNVFTKTVNYSAPVVCFYNPDEGEIVGIKQLLFSKKVANDNFSLIQENYAYKHKVFEANEEHLLTFENYYPNIFPAEQEQLFNGLIDNIKNKKAKATDLATGKKINAKDIKEYAKNISFKDIETIEFIEDIYYNFETLNYKKIVKTLTLYKTVINDNEKNEFPWIKIEMNYEK